MYGLDEMRQRISEPRDRFARNGRRDEGAECGDAGISRPPGGPSPGRKRPRHGTSEQDRRPSPKPQLKSQPSRDLVPGPSGLFALALRELHSKAPAIRGRRRQLGRRSPGPKPVPGPPLRHRAEGHAPTPRCRSRFARSPLASQSFDILRRREALKCAELGSQHLQTSPTVELNQSRNYGFLLGTRSCRDHGFLQLSIGNIYRGLHSIHFA